MKVCVPETGGVKFRGMVGRDGVVLVVLVVLVGDVLHIQRSVARLSPAD